MVARPDNSTALPLPPGDMGWPVLGKTFAFLRDPDFAAKQQRQYGSVFKTRLLGRPTVFVSGVEANQFLLTNENKYFAATWPPSTRALLGNDSLATQRGSLHQQRRKLLAQAFQPRALAGYTPAIARITREYLQRWEQAQTLTWYPELRNYTFDIAGWLFVGTANASQLPLGKLFETWCGGLFSLPIPLPWTAFGRAMRSRRALLAYIEAIARDRMAQSDPGHDALGILLQATDENGDRLSLAELQDQILLLLFAGHETLTAGLAAFCLLLAQHPAVRDRARAEQDALGREAELAPDLLKQTPYLDAVLKEVLRLIPPVGGGFREVITPCEFQGYQLPKGWMVLYQINLTHQHEALYPNPQAFDPDRFLATNEKQPIFGYVPFGGGLRECLGKEFARLEMKLFASELLRHYEWELLPDQDLSLTVAPTPHPRDGLKVRIHHR